MAPLHLYSWELLELGTLNNRLFLFQLPQSLFEQIEHRTPHPPHELVARPSPARLSGPSSTRLSNFCGEPKAPIGSSPITNLLPSKMLDADLPNEAAKPGMQGFLFKPRMPDHRVLKARKLQWGRYLPDMVPVKNLGGEPRWCRKDQLTSAYAMSKLADLMFGLELQNRLTMVNSPIASICAHPGYSITNIKNSTRCTSGFSMLSHSPFLRRAPLKEHCRRSSQPPRPLRRQEVSMGRMVFWKQKAIPLQPRFLLGRKTVRSHNSFGRNRNVSPVSTSRYSRMRVRRNRRTCPPLQGRTSAIPSLARLVLLRPGRVQPRCKLLRT